MAPIFFFQIFRGENEKCMDPKKGGSPGLKGLVI